MADTILVRALKGKPKTLNLCNKKLDRVPKAIGKLDCVIHLQLRGNKLKDLPLELSHLYQVRYLHLRNFLSVSSSYTENFFGILISTRLDIRLRSKTRAGATCYEKRAMDREVIASYKTL